MLKELLNNSALDKNIQNNYGKNAIAIALQAHPKDNELMIALINQGINPFAEDIKGNSPYSIMKKYESGEITKGGNKLNIEPVIQDDRTCFQKIEAKFSVTFFLFRERKWH
ncbi:MAG: hypothetical protein LBB84_07785 [Tannerellaceae bacterium]|nr:hypothetical protein [Tannerellaceae bacterium]